MEHLLQYMYACMLVSIVFPISALKFMVYIQYILLNLPIFNMLENYINT
jgi:hypothetical protein